jgi:hypothetical protein
VDGLRAGGARGVDDALDAQVAVRGRRPPMCTASSQAATCFAFASASE